MGVFQHVAWGYELTYPDDWIHATLGEVEGFAAIPEALTPDYDGKLSGQVLVRAEFNGLGQPIEPIWTRHIGMLAGWGQRMSALQPGASARRWASKPKSFYRRRTTGGSGPGSSHVA